MTRDEILQAFDRMRVWQRADRRALHKHLPEPFALARVGGDGMALIGSHDTAGQVPACHGASLILPQSGEYLPQEDILEWHRKQVFKSPARRFCEST